MLFGLGPLTHVLHQLFDVLLDAIRVDDSVGVHLLKCRTTFRRIENVTTGAVINLNVPIVPSETIKVIIMPGENRIESDVFAGSVAYLPSSNLSDFYLDPGRDNRISFFVDAVDYLTYNMEWKNTYWGVDS